MLCSVCLRVIIFLLWISSPFVSQLCAKRFWICGRPPNPLHLLASYYKYTKFVICYFVFTSLLYPSYIVVLCLIYSWLYTLQNYNSICIYSNMFDKGGSHILISHSVGRLISYLRSDQLNQLRSRRQYFQIFGCDGAFE